MSTPQAPTAAELAAWLTQTVPAHAIETDDEWEHRWSPALAVKSEGSALRVSYVIMPGSPSSHAEQVIALSTARVHIAGADCPWTLAADRIGVDGSVLASGGGAVALLVYGITAEESEARRSRRNSPR